MSKKLTAKSRKTIGDQLLIWVRLHKAATALIIFALIIVGLISYAAYSDYTSKFSKEDFDKLASMAQAVLDDSGGTDVQIDRTCSYRHGEFITVPSLNCQLSMVTYLPYNSDNYALNAAKVLDADIRSKFGQPYITFSSVYQRPELASDGEYMKLTDFPGNNTCIFWIHTKKFAEDAVAFLPKKTDDNLIALSFECSAESRAVYFPLTD